MSQAAIAQELTAGVKHMRVRTRTQIGSAKIGKWMSGNADDQEDLLIGEVRGVYSFLKQDVKRRARIL
ncbi:hypothetical protein [Capsulimonas corticalis]|uniref:hypothetical protein n=1 Tax=Capsulimonas corticalis TaxID=2219043 RepID=UPI000F64F375|nr:hypothetical protein [Capsulimonas corticalis]